MAKQPPRAYDPQDPVKYQEAQIRTQYPPGPQRDAAIAKLHGKPYKPASRNHQAVIGVKNPAGDTIGRLTGTRTVTTNKGMTPVGQINVKGIQEHLIKAGYHITASGKLDRLTKSALGDYLKISKAHPLGAALATILKGSGEITAITGKRNPKAWNNEWAKDSSAALLSKPLTTRMNSAGNRIPQGGGGDPSAPLINDKYKVPSGKLININKLGAKPNELSMDFAKQIAHGDWDAAIKTAQRELNRQPAQHEQNIHDLQTWYGQIGAHEDQARTRDIAAGKAATNSVADAGQALLASLGGSDSGAANPIANAVQDATGTEANLGLVQNQYNNNLAPLLASEKAGMLANQNNIDTQTRLGLGDTLEGLQGKLGAEIGQNTVDFTKYNNDLRSQGMDRMAALIQANNATRQQGFQNKLAIGDQRTAALLAGARLMSAQTRAVSAKPGKQTFGGQTSDQLKKTGNEFLQYITPNAGNPQKAVSDLAGLIRNNGWSFTNPKVRVYANNILNLAGVKVHPNWIQTK